MSAFEFKPTSQFSVHSKEFKPTKNNNKIITQSTCSSPDANYNSYLLGNELLSDNLKITNSMANSLVQNSKKEPRLDESFYGNEQECEDKKVRSCVEILRDDIKDTRSTTDLEGIEAKTNDETQLMYEPSDVASELKASLYLDVESHHLVSFTASRKSSHCFASSEIACNEEDTFSNALRAPVFNPTSKAFQPFIPSTNAPVFVPTSK